MRFLAPLLLVVLTLWTQQLSVSGWSQRGSMGVGITGSGWAATAHCQNGIGTWFGVFVAGEPYPRFAWTSRGMQTYRKGVLTTTEGKRIKVR